MLIEHIFSLILRFNPHFLFLQFNPRWRGCHSPGVLAVQLFYPERPRLWEGFTGLKKVNKSVDSVTGMTGDTGRCDFCQRFISGY